MQRYVDYSMLIICVLCFILFIVAWTSKTDRMLRDCTIQIPNEKGYFCQQRDYQGNIYYVRK